MRLRPSWIILSSAIILTAAQAPSAQTPTGHVRGHVIGSAAAHADSSRVAGLLISIDGGRWRATTDDVGGFQVADVTPGTHSLIVSRGEEPLITRAVTIAGGDTVDVEIALRTTRTTLAPVVVSADRALHVIGHLGDVSDDVIYAGKKTELIIIDSLRANLAVDVERQILGRIPGAHFSETAGAGFPSNGVSFRGLDPTQSLELNTRQNGVSIAADLFGYPETYYTPPAEALERIEVVRGAGSLAFGPQFGGAINYIVRHGKFGASPTVTSRQTAGSYGLLNSFNSIGGGSRSLSYYAFLHYRGADGQRPNSDYRQTTAYASTSWHATERLTLSAEHTRYRNRIHMAGGLSDQQFSVDPTRSYRARNWLASPWNVSALRADYVLSPRVRLESTLSYLATDRHLVWRNEDGGPSSLDEVDPATGAFAAREVERETFENWTSESRLRVDHRLLGHDATLTSGVRAGWNRMYRFAGGPGSTGSDFDMRLHGGTWERALYFRTPSVAAFAEELVRPTDRLSITLGVRRDQVRSTARGYTDVDSTFVPRSVEYNLFGVGAQYLTSESTALYGNISQAYRPILYEALTPLGSVTRVDPTLRAAHGYNAETGWRGTLRDALKVDVGLFYLSYRDRIGTRSGNDASGEFTETTNIGNSVHRGAEAYVEFDPLIMNGRASSVGNVDLFTSLAYVDARYVSGQFSGNRVEQAPRVVGRVGATYGLGRFSSTLQLSHTSKAYGDANNGIVATDDAVAGLVPAYSLLDYSGQLAVGSGYQLTFGVNNLANARYFTKRTGEYPGPGILPGAARSVYGGIAARF
jgi:Fe(3+) dicitrate transport protein